MTPSTEQQQEALRTALALGIAALGEDQTAAEDMLVLGESYQANGGDPWLMAGALAGMCAVLATMYADAIGAPGPDAPRELLARVALALAERDG